MQKRNLNPHVAQFLEPSQSDATSIHNNSAMINDDVSSQKGLPADDDDVYLMNLDIDTSNQHKSDQVSDIRCPSSLNFCALL
jgi:hypothetical protein